MELTEIETNKGKRSLICDGFRYRVDSILKDEVVSWRCSSKGCNARIRTDSGAKNVLNQRNEHNHEQDQRKLERHALRSVLKMDSVLHSIEQL